VEIPSHEEEHILEFDSDSLEMKSDEQEDIPVPNSEGIKESLAKQLLQKQSQRFDKSSSLRIQCQLLWSPATKKITVRKWSMWKKDSSWPQLITILPASIINSRRKNNVTKRVQSKNAPVQNSATHLKSSQKDLSKLSQDRFQWPIYTISVETTTNYQKDHTTKQAVDLYITNETDSLMRIKKELEKD